MLIGEGDSFDNQRCRENEIEVEGFWRGWSTWHTVTVTAIAVEAGAEADGPNKAAKTSRHWRCRLGMMPLGHFLSPALLIS